MLMMLPFWTMGSGSSSLRLRELMMLLVLLLFPTVTSLAGLIEEQRST